MTLVGLIAKNGILIVQFANLEQARGLSKVAAVQGAAVTRLRPILMTTIATVAGHFPLTLVSGPGAAARNSIGIVLVGGMAIGTHLHAVRGPVGLRAGGQGSQQGARAPGARPGADPRQPAPGLTTAGRARGPQTA